MTSLCQAAVIGSGPNGLSAAIRLAEAGVRVLVLEEQPVPGGAVRTEALTLPGFRHDTFSSVYPAGAASPVFARMPLERHGLRWIEPQACYAHPLPDGRAVALFHDVERTAASLERIATGDGARWSGFVRPMLRHFDALRATMLAGFPPIPGALRLLGGLGPAGAVRFAGLVAGSAEALGQRLFRGSAARAWLLGTAGHADTPPSAAGSAIGATYLNVLGHAVGWPSPEGGAGRLTDALVGYLQELGGEVRCGATVEHVEVARGRVTGVIVGRDGTEERIPAELVIADVMPHALLRLAGDALGGRYRALATRYRYGPATVKVDWALDAPIPWEAHEARLAGTVHVAGEEAELVRTLRETRDGLPQRPYLLLGQQTIADPHRAPPGKHTGWAYTHAPARGIDWLGELDRHVERIEAQVERFAPGFRKRILARHVLGPGDLERRDRNLVTGDVGGGSLRLRQIVFRPIPALSPYRTPVAGLYLGSAAAFPGAAVHGVPGDAAARAALSDARRGTGGRAGSSRSVGR